ncbi:MAG: 1-(5-phosphoribosyl)-5-[(5-phosphoribosylamino)methylideneamino]imidazole-4-carboxamide isomerase [Candidatus Heteroscillospira sp.]|jgi:phosphoribosylformimino-5-aminoimidazole carboxamide ribotide isomerase
MNIFPAIDLYDGKAVRLYKGDYDQMTVYSDDPVSVALSFRDAGAEYLHVVDLAGAKTGGTPNLELIARIVRESGLKTQVGGGIRSEEVIRAYLDAGVMRVILGTAAVTDPDFTRRMTEKYGAAIAVGVDVKNGFVATHGWTEVSDNDCFGFCRSLAEMGVKTVICTDISKDGAMSGTNLPLYKELSEQFEMDIVASGGVSSMEDVRALTKMDVYGAILGKALYTGGIDLAQAIGEARA